MTILSGYKTYIVALAAIVGALAAIATGEMSVQQAAHVVVDALLAAGIRSGIANS